MDQQQATPADAPVQGQPLPTDADMPDLPDDVVSGDATDHDDPAAQQAGTDEPGAHEGAAVSDDPEERAAADGRSPGELLLALEAAQAERDQVATERDDYLDALQRSRAEFENYRRRATREAQAARGAGVGDLATKLLDVLDDIDRTAEAAAGSSDDALAGGIRAVQRKIADVLVGVGVERVDQAGVPFDATRHEAVQQVPAEEPVDEPEVAQVLRPGYLLGDRVLRAAMVAVRQ